jgi:hypothetical protein
MEKEYRIPCLDSEILQTTLDKSGLPTTVNAAASELNKCARGPCCLFLPTALMHACSTAGQGPAQQQGCMEHGPRVLAECT